MPINPSATMDQSLPLLRVVGGKRPSARVRDCGGELGTRCCVDSGAEDGMLNAKGSMGEATAQAPARDLTMRVLVVTNTQSPRWLNSFAV